LWGGGRVSTVEYVIYLYTCMWVCICCNTARRGLSDIYAQCPRVWVCNTWGSLYISGKCLDGGYIFSFNLKPPNTTNLSWLQHKALICSPSLTLPTLINQLACFYDSAKVATNIWDITWKSKKLTLVIYHSFVPLILTNQNATNLLWFLLKTSIWSPSITQLILTSLFY